MKMGLKVSGVREEGDFLVVAIDGEDGSIRFEKKGQLKEEGAIKPGDTINVTLSVEKVSDLERGAEVTGRFHAVIERGGKAVESKKAVAASSAGQPRSRDF